MTRGVICLLGCALLASWGASPASAQLPPQQRGRGWLQFRVVAGRIVTTTQRGGRTMSSSTKSNSRAESLTINFANGVPVFRYELGTQEEHVTIAGASDEEFTLRRDPRGDSTDPVVELTQPARGWLTLSVQLQADAAPRVVSGATLWHLVLAEPEVMQNEVLPIVELLQPDWKLAELAGKVEGALLATANQPRADNRQAWSALVAELANDRFAAREAADRKLRSAGVAIAPYLNGLDRRQLTAEQRIRVRRIAASVDRDVPDDSPERIAEWLAWDPKAWFRLLDRSDAAVRQSAALQLAQLLDSPIEFDADADETTRKQQIEQLRSLLEPPAPPAVNEMPDEDS